MTTKFIDPPKIDPMKEPIINPRWRFYVSYTLELKFWLVIFVCLIALLITKVVQDSRVPEPVEMDNQAIVDTFECEELTGFEAAMCKADKKYAERVVNDLLGE